MGELGIDGRGHVIGSGTPERLEGSPNSRGEKSPPSTKGNLFLTPDLFTIIRECHCVEVDS